MAIPKSKRTTTPLSVLIEADTLACYTILICTDESRFPKRYRWCLTQQIIESAVRAKMHIANANSVYVNDHESAILRRTYQQEAIAAVRKRVRDDWACQLVEQIIDSFPGDVGIGLGSDVAQYIELAVLDDLDHFIKEQLRVRFYARYMDDFVIITDGKEHAAEYRKAIEQELTRIHLQLHPKKCRVVPVSRGFKWIGFRIRVKPSGKILVTLSKDKIYHERRKLKKMVKLIKAGKLSRNTAEVSLRCWAAHAARGNNHNVIKKMYEYYQNLWRDANVQDNHNGRTLTKSGNDKPSPALSARSERGTNSLRRNDERRRSAGSRNDKYGGRRRKR